MLWILSYNENRSNSVDTGQTWFALIFEIRNPFLLCPMRIKRNVHLPYNATLLYSISKVFKYISGLLIKLLLQGKQMIRYQRLSWKSQFSPMVRIFVILLVIAIPQNLMDVINILILSQQNSIQKYQWSSEKVINILLTLNFTFQTHKY